MLSSYCINIFHRKRLGNIFKIVLVKSNCFGVYSTDDHAEDPEDYLKDSHPRRLMHAMRKHKNKKVSSASISAEKVISEGLKKKRTIKEIVENPNTTGNTLMLQDI